MEKEYDVRNIKTNKKKLEEDIFNLIKSFELENACFVDGIDFTWASEIGDIIEQKHSVTVKLKRI